MKTILIILLFTIAAQCGYGNHQSVIISGSPDVVLQNTNLVDVTLSGKWAVNFFKDQWQKAGHNLYLNKAARSIAVKDAQQAVKDQFAIIVKAAIEGGFYEVLGSGAGFTLSGISEFEYQAAAFDTDGTMYVTSWQNEEYHTLKLYPVAGDKSTAVNTAKTNIDTNLDIISTAADAGGFHSE